MAELIAVVDKNDRFIRSESRNVIHSLGLFHRVAHVFLYNNSGQILLQLRSNKKEIYPNKWDCTISEHLNLNEQWRKAAERGLLEELGIKGLKLKEILYCRANYGLEGKVISKIFECSGLVTIRKSAEVGELRFFSEKELKGMLRTNERAFAIWAAEQLKWKLGMHNNLEPL